MNVFCYAHATSLPSIFLSISATSPDSFEKALSEGKNLRKLGQLAEATHAFQKAADQAARVNAYGRQAEALVAKSGCEIRLFRYAAALRSTQAARTLALRVNNYTYAGAADNNFSTIFSQLGDFSAARIAAVESVEFLAESPRKDYYLRALSNKGEIEFGLHQTTLGTESFRRALVVAKKANLPQFEALASDHLGSWLTLIGNLTEAEPALQYAQRLFQIQQDNDGLAGSYEHLAELEWRKGGPFLTSALAHIDLAFSTKSEAFKINPQYYPIHIRGQILLGLGQRDKALADFRRAVNSADTWRQSALPGDTTSTQTVVQLDSVYKDYAQLAAELSLERGEQSLAREAFDVLERNRAASLREQLTRSYSGKLLKSPEYFNLLQQLQAAQASATLGKDSAQEQVDRKNLDQIRAKLSALGNQIGLDQHNLASLAEKKTPRNSLKGIQARLSVDEALLSFSLGERKSFLWAVTRDDVRLYDLPRQEIIAHQAETFSRAVAANLQDRVVSGRALSSSLFSHLPLTFQSKPNWLLTPDGALLDKVPFASLPAIFEGSDQPLVATHTIRLLPSASLLRGEGHALQSGRFLGVADPIYNLADSRRDRTAGNATGLKDSRPAVPHTILGRLVSSQVEVRTSAEKCGLPQTTLLFGKDASGLKLRQVIQPPPEILHFAVHVVSPKDFPQEAAIALSLTRDRLPELLTAESIATYRVPGSLVVLSGCASQQGEVLPGAGLVGLSRGWLLAGAAAVVVSAWPTPDESGSFFSTFYTRYRQTSGSVGTRAATALQQTQLDMQRSSGYQRDPKFWAAYSVISKE